MNLHFSYMHINHHSPRLNAIKSSQGTLVSLMELIKQGFLTDQTDLFVSICHEDAGFCLFEGFYHDEIVAVEAEIFVVFVKIEGIFVRILYFKVRLPIRLVAF